MTGTPQFIDFDAPAVLRKWPSLRNERRTEGYSPYSLFDGTLRECIETFMAKPVSVRHLYEIHTTPQPSLTDQVLRGDAVVELARLKNFFAVLGASPSERRTAVS